MRIVVKIGTSTLAHSGGRLNIRRVELLCCPGGPRICPASRPPRPWASAS